jgi:hypothetical protein
VYFSVLAALGPRDPAYCPEALQVAAEVEASGLVSQRPDIASNITAAEQYCADLAGGAVAPSAEGTTTPGFEPVLEGTPTATPMPSP